MAATSAIVELAVICFFILIIWGAAAGCLWLIGRFEMPKPVKWFVGGALLLIVLFATAAIIDHHYPTLLHHQF